MSEPGFVVAAQSFTPYGRPPNTGVVLGAADGDLLVWDAAVGEWVPSSSGTATGSRSFFVDLYNQTFVDVAAVGAFGTTLQTLAVPGVIAGDVVVAYLTSLPASNIVCGAGIGGAPGVVSMPMYNVSATPYAGDTEAMLFMVTRFS